MGLPVFKKCCCCELKWGPLVVGLVDILLLVASLYTSSGISGQAATLWIVCIWIHVIHIIGCILVIVSVWVENKDLDILYLISGVVRMVFDLIFLIYLCLDYTLGDYVLYTVVILLVSVVLGIYFWLVIYAWYQKLGGSGSTD